MSVKGKRITNVGDPLEILPNDTDPTRLEKIAQGVNVGYLNSHTLTTIPEDQTNYYGNNRQIYELADAKVFKNTDVFTIPDPIE